MGTSEIVELPRAEGPAEPAAPPRRHRALAVAGIVLAAVIASGAVAWWVSTSSVFAMRRFTVHGNRRTTTEELERLAAVGPRTNVLWANLGRIEHRLESDPWVLRASVTRHLPSTFVVTVVERTPVARAGTPAMLVSADGLVLARAGSHSRLPMLGAGGPLAAGSRLRSPGLLRIAAALASEIPGRVSRVDADPYGSIELTLADGVPVHFGDTSQTGAKARSLRAILAWATRNGVRPAYVDVSAPAAPALLPVTAVPAAGRSPDASANPSSSPTPPTGSTPSPPSSSP